MATSTFDINLLKINHFKNKVLYIEPEINDNLINLQRTFDGNYADNYDWTPHVTLFCGNQMSEFYPTKIIIDQPLQTDINLVGDI